MKLPQGTPSIHLLIYLDEKQLCEVNKRIVEQYQKELTHQNMALFKKQEEEQYAERVRSLNKLTHEGPALRRMAGKIKLKGEDSSSEEEG